MKTLQAVSVTPDNAVVVVVDVQNEFCKPGGKRYTETSARVAPAAISAIRGLTQRAQLWGIPIIYIQSVRTLREPEFTVFGHEPFLEIGTWGASIVDELAPQQGDIVVQKFCHDPFHRTDLDRVLQGLVPDPTRHYAIITGGGINVCVYHAVMGFYLRNYWAVVPVDCVYYSADSARQIALEQFSLHAYPSVFLSRSDLIAVSRAPAPTTAAPVSGK